MIDTPHGMYWDGVYIESLKNRDNIWGGEYGDEGDRDGQVFRNFDEFFSSFTNFLNLSMTKRRKIYKWSGCMYPHNDFCIETLSPMEEMTVRIDARDVLNGEDLCDRTSVMGAEYVVLEQFFEEGAKELQGFLDSWCGVNAKKQLKKNTEKKIDIPWCEWFGLEERG